MSSKSRKNARAVVQLVARYRSPTVFNFVEEECYDLSTGGMFIKSPAPAPAGTLLKLECDADDGERQIKAVARVVWARLEEDQDGPIGMGVKFIKLEPGGKELIEQLIAGRASLIPGGERYRGSSIPPAAREAMDSEAPAVGPISDVAPAPEAEEPAEEAANAPAPEADEAVEPEAEVEAATTATPETDDSTTPEGADDSQVEEAAEVEPADAPAEPEGHAEPEPEPEPEPEEPASDDAAKATDDVSRDARAAAAVEAPASAAHESKGSNGIWVALVAALVLGAAIWFQSMDSGEAPKAAPAPGAPAAAHVPEEAAHEEAIPEEAAPEEPPPEEAAPENAEGTPEESGATDAAEPKAADETETAPAAAEEPATEAPAAEEPAAEEAAKPAATGATRYLIHVITRPGGARVTYRDKHIYAPGNIELDEAPAAERIRAEKAGYHATAADINATDFEPSEDTPGLMIRRIYLVLKKD